jgi:single-strand DNA-binding protein
MTPKRTAPQGSLSRPRCPAESMFTPSGAVVVCLPLARFSLAAVAASAPYRGLPSQSSAPPRRSAALLGCVSHTTTTLKEETAMNSINITGRLTTDPELRQLPSGENVCKLRLAVDGLAPNRETGYLNVACFGKPGEAAARVLAKGWLVAVAGRLSYQQWETDDGSKRHDYEVVGNVEFLTAPRAENTDAPQPQAQAAAA